MKIPGFYPPVGSRAGEEARGASNAWFYAILREREEKKTAKKLTNSDRSKNLNNEGK